MIRYSSEVTIELPPHAVYEALLDPSLYPRWTGMVDVSLDGVDASLEPLAAREVRAGERRVRSCAQGAPGGRTRPRGDDGLTRANDLLLTRR